MSGEKNFACCSWPAIGTMLELRFNHNLTSEDRLRESVHPQHLRVVGNGKGCLKSTINNFEFC